MTSCSLSLSYYRVQQYSAKGPNAGGIRNEGGNDNANSEDDDGEASGSKKAKNILKGITIQTPQFPILQPIISYGRSIPLFLLYKVVYDMKTGLKYVCVCHLSQMIT